MKKNRYGYNIVLCVCDDMNSFDLYQLVEFLYNFNFPIMNVGEKLYCSSSIDYCDFDLRIAIIEHDEKLVYLEMA